jgi:tetratricopeptide (TPR) repeat protein
MAADAWAIFLKILEKLCTLCGTALEKHPAIQVFFAVITPLVLFLCLIFLALSPYKNTPLSMLLSIAFTASALIALLTIHAKIIRPGLQNRYAAMEQFLEQELSMQHEEARQSLWKDHAGKVGLDPQDFLEHLGGGNEYQKGLRALLEQRYDVAISHFKMLTKAGNAEQALGNVFLGHALYSTGLYPQALEAYERAAVMDPESVSVWSGTGRCLLELKRYEDALKALNKSIELDPKIAPIWRKKGEALQRLERHRDALHALEKAIGLNRPGDADTWKLKGYLFGQSAISGNPWKPAIHRSR